MKFYGDNTFKKGISCMISHPEKPSIEKQLELFAEMGFESVFFAAGTISDFSKIVDFSNFAKICGVEIEAVHAPSWGVGDVWRMDKNSKAYQEEIENVIRHCNAGKVPMLVMHTALKGDEPITDKGLEFYEKIGEIAKINGVKIAYENANSVEHLKAVLQHSDSFHGFCYDFGHKHCYEPDVDMLAWFGDRLLYTHIHDNIKALKKDMHLLPFDGDIQWKEEISKLKQMHYQGTWNLELSASHSQQYQNVSFRAFIEEAKCRLEALYKL